MIYSVNNLPCNRVFIGYPGEENFRPKAVHVDVSSWLREYPDGTVSVTYKRHDGMTYPVLVQQTGNIVTWTPLRADLAEGPCALQYTITAPGTTGKSAVMSCVVGHSLDDPNDPPQEPRPTFVEDVIQAANRAEDAVEHYPQIRDGYWWVWDAESGKWVNTGVKAGGSGGGADVFIAVRGTTTEAEIRAAHSDGKVVICVYQSRVYYLSDISDNASEIVFRTTPNQLGNTYALVVNGSRWIGLTTNLARKSDIPTVPITGVSVNGTELTPSDGVVDVQVPTDYVNDVMFHDRTDVMNIMMSYSNGIVSIEESGMPLSTLIDFARENCNVWFLLPTAYITGIPSNTDMMRFQMTGANLDTSAPTVSLTSVYNGKVYHAVLSPVSEYRMEGQLQVLDYQTSAQVQSAIAAIPDELPTVTASDNGKFLRVVNGAWAAETVQTWQGGSY